MLNFGLIPEASATKSGATRLLPGLFFKRENEISVPQTSQTYLFEIKRYFYIDKIEDKTLSLTVCKEC
jgi:hypothetical protein